MACNAPLQPTGFLSDPVNSRTDFGGSVSSPIIAEIVLRHEVSHPGTEPRPPAARDHAISGSQPRERCLLTEPRQILIFCWEAQNPLVLLLRLKLAFRRTRVVRSSLAPKLINGTEQRIMPPLPSANVPADLGSLDMESLAQQRDVALTEIKAYEVKFILNTGAILALQPSENPLHWDSIRFDKREIHRVPNNQRGLYAFIIADQRKFLPPHGYIMYIGIAGRRSHRSLRARYQDYFKQSEVERRPVLGTMIARPCGRIDSGACSGIPVRGFV